MMPVTYLCNHFQSLTSIVDILDKYLCVYMTYVIDMRRISNTKMISGYGDSGQQL